MEVYLSEYSEDILCLCMNCAYKMKDNRKCINNGLNFTLLFCSNPSTFKEILQVQVTP